MTRRAELPDGTKINGPAELRKVLLNHSDEFLTTITEKLLTYALGRGLEAADAPAVRKIKRDAATRELPLCVADSGYRHEHTVSDENGARARELNDRIGGSGMVITKIALPRRTFLRGMGAIAGAASAGRNGAGDVGSNQGGASVRGDLLRQRRQYGRLDAATEGRRFQVLPDPETARGLSGPDARPDRTGQLSGDGPGRRWRPASARRAGLHELRPSQATEGADVQAGTTVDQIIARDICTDTKLPSLELSVDRNDVVGACDHGYACAYMNSISWKSRRCRCRRKPILALSSSGCLAAGTPPKSAGPEARKTAAFSMA